MLNKFFNKISTASTIIQSSNNEKIANYNKEVIAKKSQEPVKKILPTIDRDYLNNIPSQRNSSKPAYESFKKQINNKELNQELDDGSYFCSYSIGGNTLVCYKNKNKVEFILDGINHSDKNHYLAKRANYFLNDLVKKKKVYITEKNNGKFEVFLDISKTTSINQLLIEEGFHNSAHQNIDSSNNNPIKTTSIIHSEPISTKKNYAYGLFATNYNTFEALFNNNKITLTLANLDLDSISLEDQKICKSMIYDFVSKKSIVLNFIKEENGIHFAEVFNKEGDCLNSLISLKDFKKIQSIAIDVSDEYVEDDTIEYTTDEQCSENDWDWAVEKNNTKIQNQKEEIDIPVANTIPAMFKKELPSNPNSPFAKKKINTDVVSNTPSVVHTAIVEEIDIPDSIIVNVLNTEDITSEMPIVKKKLSFGKR